MAFALAPVKKVGAASEEFPNAGVLVDMKAEEADTL